MSSWMDKAKKFRSDHAETFDKIEAKGRELAEQGKEKLDEARDRFDEEQAKREGADKGKPDVLADEGAAPAADTKPEDAPPPAPPAGATPPPPPPAAA